MGKTSKRDRKLSITATKRRIQALRSGTKKSRENDRELCDVYRDLLRHYEDSTRNLDTESGNVKEFSELKALAKEAILYLSGEADVSATSLKDYDSDRYGPYLGVSDEGSAVDVIRRAALASPKALAIGSPTPLELGVAHDAERLGAIGEVPVGPEEYADIRLGAIGRILTSTNVGTRLNLRFYKRNPVVTVPKGSQREALALAKRELQKQFRPFLKTPDGKPRPLIVFVEFHRESRRSFGDRVGILQALSEYVKRSGIADPTCHSIGFQARIGYGAKGRKAALLYIDLASAAKLKVVAIDGVVSKEGDAALSLPGLLNYLAPEDLDEVLERAERKRIQIRPTNMVDTDTVARTVWSALLAAKHYGIALGKYGTFPLTLEETDRVVGLIQKWFADWSAAPVFFVDQGILTARKVYTGKNIIEGIKKWLEVIAKHHVPVVLIDTMDKSSGFKILKDKSTGDKGLLTLEQIQIVDSFALKNGIKTLWAGGISLSQSYDFGKLNVFGIYVTSAAAATVPVTPDYREDPLLPAQKEPTYQGVYRSKLLLESGFLAKKMADTGEEKNIEVVVRQLVDVFDKRIETSQIENHGLEQNAAQLVERVWKQFFSLV